MRIGLYGLPTAGKTFILDRIQSLETLSGSLLLEEISPDFHTKSSLEKKCIRQKLASYLSTKDDFIMDGHYSFGDKVVFTLEDGCLYDVFLYLYVNPEIIKERMLNSYKNRKYAVYDIKHWQQYEIESLRKFCHERNKDFYVLDNPKLGYFSDVQIVIDFIDSIVKGYSCVSFARKCFKEINDRFIDKTIVLADGDKTLTFEDSSGILGYRTDLFDGNFYSGFQFWRHDNSFKEFLKCKSISNVSLSELDISINRGVVNSITNPCVILTSGYHEVWRQIGDLLSFPIYYGAAMSADTKFFITKFLQEEGKNVIAYGDGMNDYYMLKQANKGYLVTKADGSVSRSLRNTSLEGIEIVRT